MRPGCLLLGVAAITYEPLAETDLSTHDYREPKELWDKLGRVPKFCLSQVAYEMAAFDVIYVKHGDEIVDRGVVTGPYRFDSELRLRDKQGIPWAHQVPVDWSRQFTPVTLRLGTSQRFTVQDLSPDEAQRAEGAIGSAENPDRPSSERAEAAYYRECPARLKVITPLHNKLSNEFCRWVENQHKVPPAQEQQYVDVRFSLKNVSVIAELKVCYGVNTTRSIREALGQLLEYNHYPSRNAAAEWLIVLDTEPSNLDKRYIDLLRDERSLPVTLGWLTRAGFSFHPQWPAGAAPC